MKTMSWPTILVTAAILLIAAYFIGQALHLDHPTGSGPVSGVVSTVSTRH